MLQVPWSGVRVKHDAPRDAIQAQRLGINKCDAARQNQALFARLRSEVELSLQAYPKKVENEFPTESVS